MLIMIGHHHDDDANGAMGWIPLFSTHDHLFGHCLLAWVFLHVWTFFVLTGNKDEILIFLVIGPYHDEVN